MTSKAKARLIDYHLLANACHHKPIRTVYSIFVYVYPCVCVCVCLAKYLNQFVDCNDFQIWKGHLCIIKTEYGLFSYLCGSTAMSVSCMKCIRLGERGEKIWRKRYRCLWLISQLRNKNIYRPGAGIIERQMNLVE